ncbi:MAG TPA: S8 family peptidase [Thermoanaerobaculia bacterium]|nr:S8 family peptidase [Thermoanaerobaculia bacterium]
MKSTSPAVSVLVLFTVLAFSGAANAQVTQSAPSNWALDRIDQRTGPWNNSYTYTTTGAGVHIYIIDSGIRLDHTEFAGRLTVNADYVAPGDNGADCYGHGTAVAGIAAGSTYGVAKGAQIHVLRVADCNPLDEPDKTPEINRVIQALGWIRWNHVKPAVVNISSNYDVSLNPSCNLPCTPPNCPGCALESAITDVLNAGVSVVVSAGNFPGPVGEKWQLQRCTGVPDCRCDWYYGCADPRMVTAGNLPPEIPGVITVGAADRLGMSQGGFWDRRLVNTHWGVDVYAPGNYLQTASIQSSTATQLFSATSAAAPVVTGVVARYLQSHPTATPVQVRSWIKGNATTQTVSKCPAWEAGMVYISPTD